MQYVNAVCVNMREAEWYVEGMAALSDNTEDDMSHDRFVCLQRGAYVSLTHLCVYMEPVLCVCELVCL